MFPGCCPGVAPYLAEKRTKSGRIHVKYSFGFKRDILDPRHRRELLEAIIVIVVSLFYFPYGYFKSLLRGNAKKG